MKFVTAALQTSGAFLGFVIMVRSFLKDRQQVIVERKDTGAQLKVHKDLSDEAIKKFAS